MQSGESHLNSLSAILTGLRFPLDTLVLGPASYICASKFGEDQGAPLKARRAADRMMRLCLARGEEQLGYHLGGSLATLFSMEDIFHSTIARLTDKVDPGSLRSYAKQAYAQVGDNLQTDPILVTVGSVFRGFALDYQSKYKPQLII